jgi:hypothetical protein
MDPRATELAAERLRRVGQFSLHAVIIAIVTAAAAVAAALWFPAATIPIMALAAAEILVVMWARWAQIDLLQRLALEPVAVNVPAVQGYRDRLLRQSSRDRLAASINSLIADAKRPYAFCLADRVALVEEQLRVLARELATPEIPVQVRSLVVCLRLISHGVESPLFNPGVPVEQLQATLLRIRFGIGRRAAG